MPLKQGRAQRLKFQLIIGGKGSEASVRKPEKKTNLSAVGKRTLPKPIATATKDSVHYKALLNALPGAVLILNGKGEICETNLIAEQWLGAGLTSCAWHQICSERLVTSRGQNDLQTQDGRFIDISTSPVGFESGQIILLTDISEQHRLRKRLERQSRLSEMGEMMARLAHQIRTPLSTALLYQGQLAHKKLSSAQQKDFAVKSLVRLRDLEKVVQDMLLFANGESRSFNAIAMDSLFAEVCSSLDPQLKKMNANLSYQVDPAVAIKGSVTSLLSALQNLCLNAVENTTVPCRIKLSAWVAADSKVTITIEDNGNGIPASMREQIFEPFFTTRSSGTGLGLAVVRSVITAHGGTIAVDNNSQGGAVFSITLPAHIDLVSCNSQQQKAG